MKSGDSREQAAGVKGVSTIQRKQRGADSRHQRRESYFFPWVVVEGVTRNFERASPRFCRKASEL